MSKVLQVRDVPDDVHRRLKLRAAEQDRSLSDLVRAELVEIARRPTMAEALARIASREPVDIAEPSADAVRAGRAER